MAAILGLSRYASPYDVWLEKTGQLEDDKTSAAADAGNRFEDAVIGWAEDELGGMERNLHVKHDGSPLAANVDAILREGGIPVEAKTAGLFGPLVERWGDDYTDDVPEAYIVQAHVHMICTERELCHLAAFIGQRGFARFVIHHNADLAGAIIEQAQSFWDRHVVACTPPEDCLPAFETVRRVKRKPGKVAVVAPEIVEEYFAANEEKKRAEARVEEAKVRLLTEGRDADAFDYGDPEKWMTFYANDTRRVDVNLLKAEHPDIAAEYTITNSSRTLRKANRPQG